MKTKETIYDMVNQIARNDMIRENYMGVRKLSYEAFKRKTREHQIGFRENELKVVFYNHTNMLKLNDAKKGLIFFEGFRKEIMDELKQPIATSSTAPSGQMLTNLLRREHIPYNNLLTNEA
jgi:hypothetical protein